jgi:GDP-L-fucose synthase
MDLVDLLVTEFEFKGKVIFDDSKPDGQFRKPSDNSKLKSYLPNFKFTSIEEGIKETVYWFKENYDRARK